MSQPDEAEPLSWAEIWVLLAILEVYATSGRATVRAVASAADLNPSTTFFHLRRLRDKGWVDWTEGTAGTMRPLVKAFPV